LGSAIPSLARLAPSVALPSWQLAADVAILPTWRYDRHFGSVIRLTAAGVVLRIHALIEAVILYPGVFVGFLERERAIGAAYRAAENLCLVINVAQLAKQQPRVACGWWGRSPEEN
jgi:hypothetical protein